MLEPSFNKFRAAIEILQKGREAIVDALADEILDQGDDLTCVGYQFNEFLELQGTRLHFVTLLLSQLEQSAEALEELRPAPPKTQSKKAQSPRKPRAKKIPQQSSKEGSTDEA
jgi:hypothetical protein